MESPKQWLSELLVSNRCAEEPYLWTINYVEWYRSLCILNRNICLFYKNEKTIYTNEIHTSGFMLQYFTI